MNVDVQGAQLHYSTSPCASGPACLVLSGIGTAPYERQMARLGERLRIVFVDLRGSGQSTGDPSGLTFDVLASDLEALRLKLGLPRIAVLGHSIMGVLAIEYGHRCPQTVSHVIAVGTPPFGDMVRLAARSASFFEEDASEERKRLLKDNLAKLPNGPSPAETMLAQTPMRFFDARVDAAPLFAGAIVKPAFFAHVFGTLTPSWVADSPSPPQVPILIAHGRHDYTVPHLLWKQAGVGASPLPNARLHIFERSGHQPFFEEPDRFAEVVVSWMNEG